MLEPKVLILGRSWGLLEASWSALGSSRGAPEAVLEQLWGVPKAVWGAFWGSEEAPAEEITKAQNSMNCLGKQWFSRPQGLQNEVKMRPKR